MMFYDQNPKKKFDVSNRAGARVRPHQIIVKKFWFISEIKVMDKPL